MGLRNFFKKRKMRKQEMHADEQYLDALEIIKEASDAYLDLWARAKQNGHTEAATRLQAKLNSDFEYSVKNWDGEVRIKHTIISSCNVSATQKRLKLE